MAMRGYSLQPIGCIEVDELCTYYYFEAGPQLVELEVVYSPRTDTFTRTITGVKDFSDRTVVVTPAQVDAPAQVDTARLCQDAIGSRCRSRSVDQQNRTCRVGHDWVAS